jgi:hypothetical protein
VAVGVERSSKKKKTAKFSNFSGSFLLNTIPAEHGPNVAASQIPPGDKESPMIWPPNPPE